MRKVKERGRTRVERERETMRRSRGSRADREKREQREKVEERGEGDSLGLIKADKLCVLCKHVKMHDKGMLEIPKGKAVLHFFPIMQQTYSCHLTDKDFYQSHQVITVS